MQPGQTKAGHVSQLARNLTSQPVVVDLKSYQLCESREFGCWESSGQCVVIQHECPSIRQVAEFHRNRSGELVPIQPEYIDVREFTEIGRDLSLKNRI